MSEIRRIKIQIKDYAAIETACKKCGLQLVKEGQKVIVKNHNIRTWNNLPVELVLQPDGSYILSGDCSKSELDKLAAKIKAQYDVVVIVKASQKLGFNVVSKEQVKDKIKIKIRKF